MMISTKGRYSLRLMLDLAQHYEDGPLSLKDISERQNISKKYLEQIVPLLTKDGLLTANRGHMGGYRLAKSPAEITVSDIVECTEGSLQPVSCMAVSPNECPQQLECLTLPVWQGLHEVVKEYLQSISLQDILDRKYSFQSL